MGQYLFIFSLLCLIATITANQFGQHGLYWGASLTNIVQISESSIWQQVQNMTVTIPENRSVSALIIYHLNVQPDGEGLDNPLPTKSLKDIIQSRILIDGIPYRSSSSSNGIYSFVAKHSILPLTGSFVAQLSSGSHIITIQWKKSGNALQSFIAGGNNLESASSVVVHTDHVDIWYRNGVQDAIITSSSSTWVTMPDAPLSFTLAKETSVTIGYSVNVIPQLASIIKDKRLEYLSTRIAIDGVGYMEGLDSYSTSSWNPSPTTLRGLYSFKLGPGHHSIELQWKKVGNVFRSWSSSPSYLDGYASSRNLFVILDKYNLAPHLVPSEHQRTVLRTASSVVDRNKWQNVPSSTMTFELVKQSAVIITYSLPVSQFGHPNLDSYSWDKLSKIETRVVVDGMAYMYSSEAELVAPAALVSSNAQLSNELPLVLAEGSHTVSLEWKTAGAVNWTTSHGTDYGYNSNAQMLVLISSNNSNPVINSATNLSIPVHVTEDVEFPLGVFSVSDTDERLYGGMFVDVILTTNIGALKLSEVPVLAYGYQTYMDVNEHATIVMHDTISMINTMLAGLVYVPPVNYNGDEVYVEVTVSDRGNIGNGDGALSSTATCHIIVDSVDDRFTLQKPSALLYVEEGSKMEVPPLNLFDVDSQGSIFAVEVSAICGYVSFGTVHAADTSLLPLLTFTSPSLVSDVVNGSETVLTLPDTSSLAYEGNYADVVSSLNELVFSASTSCNRNQHGSIMAVRVMNTDNYDHNVSITLDIVIVPVNAAPEIVANRYPRWSLDGIQLVASADAQESNYTYAQLPLGEEQLMGLSAASAITEFGGDVNNRIWNQGSASSGGEVAIISGDRDSYMLQIQFHNYVVELVSSSYVPFDTENIPITFKANFYYSESQLFCKIDNMNYLYPALQNQTSGLVLCHVNILESEKAYNGNWIQLISEDGNVRSNFVQLFSQRQPAVIDFTPTTMLLSDAILLRLFVVDAAPVDRCFIGGDLGDGVTRDVIAVQAVTTPLSEHYSVVCSVSNADHKLRTVMGVLPIRVGSADGYFISNEIDLVVSADPVVMSAEFKFLSTSDLVDVPPTMVSINGWWDLEAMTETEVVCLTGDFASAPIEIASGQIVCPYVCYNEHESIEVELESAVYFDQNHTDMFALRGLEPFSLSANSVGYTAFLAPLQKYIVSVVGNGTINLSEDVSVDIVCGPEDISCRNVLLVRTPTTIEVHMVTHADFSVVLTNNAELTTVRIDIMGVLSACGDGAESLPVSLRFGTWSSAGIKMDLLAHATESYLANRANTVVVEGIDAIFSGNSLVMSNSWIEFSSGDSYDALDSFAALVCQFNEEFTSPTLIFEKNNGAGVSVSCIVPDFGGDSTGSVVTVRLFDQYSSVISQSTEIVVASMPVLSNMSQNLGTAGTVVALTASSEIELWTVDRISCKFGEVSVAAAVAAGGIVSCVAPPMQHGSTRFQVVVDGVQVYSNSFVYDLSAPIVDSATTPFDSSSVAIFSDLYPTFGSVNGGNTVFFDGVGFATSVASFVCHFGNKAVTMAHSVSDSEGSCVAPASKMGGEVVFKLTTIDGVEIKTSGDGSNELIYRYVDIPVVLSVTPNIGYSAGGTSIDVLLDSDAIDQQALYQSIFCHFVDAFGNMETVTASAIADVAGKIQCMSPSHNAGSTAIYVEIDGVLSEAGISFTYLETPAMVSVEPNVGSVLGGTAVSITGTGFTSSINKCCFGTGVGDNSWSHCSSAVLLDSNTLICSTVPRVKAIDASSGDSSVVVDVYLYESDNLVVGNHVSVNVAGFTYLDNAVITRVSTARGGVHGGTPIHLFGGLFTEDNIGSECTCKFVFNSSVEVFMPIRIVSEIEIECLSPSSLEYGGDVTADFSVHFPKATVVQPEGLTFSFDISPTITAVVSPIDSKLPTSGYVDLVLSCDNVSPLDELRCVFDNSVTGNAVVVGSNTVLCAVPAHPVGPISFFIEVQGSGLLSNVIDLSYTAVSGNRSASPLAEFVSGEVAVALVDTLLVTDVQPLYAGVNSTATEVHVTIAGLVSVNQFREFVCAFGALGSVTAKVITNEMLSCVAPVGHSVQSVALSVYAVDADGVMLPLVSLSLNENIFFNYIETPSIDYIFPNVGYTSGGTLINVYGSALDGVVVQCVFGSASNYATVGASIVSNSHVKCTAPSQSGGKVPFAVKVNEVRSRDAISFSYLLTPIIYKVSPSSFSTQGGTVITITGSKELETIRSCVFDRAVVTPLLSSFDPTTSSVSCASPAVPSGAVGTVEFSLSSSEDISGIITSTSTVTFTNNVAVVTSFAPRFGSTMEDTVVTFEGVGLSTVSNCIFNDTVTVEAYRVNETAILCVTPPLSEGRVVVKFDSNSAEVVFTYITPPTTVSLFPSEGKSSEVAYVTMTTGGGLNAGASYRCVFDLLVSTPGYVVSENEVDCKLPLLGVDSVVPRRDISVNLFVNDVPAVNSSPLTFNYIANTVGDAVAPGNDGVFLLSSAYPLSGGVNGGAIVTLRGIGFVSYADLSCQFGSQKVPASILSATTATCVVPSVASAQVVSLTMGSATNTAFDFEYVVLPVVSSISPTSGFASGGMDVHVHAAKGGFATPGSVAACKFGTLKVLGVLISDSEIVCVQPHLPVGITTVNVIVHSTVLSIVPNASTSINIRSTPVVTDVAPLVGTVVGGTVVTAHMDVIEASVCGCRFGGVAGNCSIADTFISCVAPSAAVSGGVQLKFSFDGLWNLVPPYLFQYSRLPSVVDVQPRVGSVIGGSLITVYGYDFSTSVDFFCSFGGVNKNIKAVVVSSNILTCMSPYSKYVVDSATLAITDADGSPLYNVAFAFHDIPVISDVTLFAKDLTAVVTTIRSFDNATDLLNSGSNWACVVKGIHVAAEVLTSNSLVCDISSVSVLRNNVLQAGDLVLYIEDLSTQLKSTEYDLSSSKIIGSFVPEPSATSSVGARSPLEFMNITEIFNPKHIIHSINWLGYEGKAADAIKSYDSTFKAEQTLTHAPVPVSHEVAFSSTNLNYVEQQQQIRKPLDNCGYQDNVPCITSIEALENVFASTIGTVDSARYLPQGVSMVTIDSIQPRLIDPVDGTVVNVVGSGYSSDVVCLLDDVTELDTVVMSTNLLQCSIPGSHVAGDNVELKLSIVVASPARFASAKIVQSNVVPLYYDLINIKRAIANSKNAVLANVDDIASSTGSSNTVTCLSSGGCVDATAGYVFSAMNKSINLESISNEADLLSLANTQKKIASSWQISSVKVLNTLIAANKLGNGLVSADSNKRSVLFVEPTSVTLQNSFDSNLVNIMNNSLVTTIPFHFYGSNFVASTDSWCASMSYSSNEYTMCRVLSSTIVQCPVDVNPDELLNSKTFSPGVNTVTLFNDCGATPIAVFEGNINIIPNLVRGIANSGISEVSSIGYAHIAAVKPLTGSTNGGTVVLMSGENLESITYCNFRSASNSASFLAVAITPTTGNGGKSCVSPAVSQPGVYELLTSSMNNPWVHSGFSFTFFAPPVLYSFSKTAAVSPDSNPSEDFYVSGESFPMGLTAYCRVRYSNSKTILRIAKTISSSLLLCPNVTSSSSRYAINQIAVSFNNLDYIAIDITADDLLRQLIEYDQIERVLGANMTTDVFSDAVVDVIETANHAITTPSGVVRDFGVGSRVDTRKVICDGSMSLYFDVTNASPFVDYVCIIDEVAVGPARYISSSILSCNIPDRYPGQYKLQIEDISALQSGAESPLTVVKASAILRCIITPTVAEIALKPRSADGVSSLLLYGHNIVAGIYCTIGTESTDAMKDTDNRAICNFEAVKPGFHEVWVQFGKAVLYRVSGCFSDNLLRNGGLVVSVDNAECGSLLSTVVVEEEAVTTTVSGVVRDITNYYPRAGPVMGTTSIQMLLPELDMSYHDVKCLFVEESTLQKQLSTGFIISDGRMFCNTPASLLPGKSSLSVSAVGGRHSFYSSIEWCCASYFAYPLLNIVSGSRSPVSTGLSNFNVSSIQLTVVGLVDTDVKLYCRIGSEVTAAFIVSLTHVSCSLPDISAKSVSISLGSSFESWSNALTLEMNTVIEGAPVTPGFGNVNGGTNLSIQLVGVTNSFVPMCYFGNGDIDQLEKFVDELVDDVFSTGTFDLEKNVVMCKSPVSNRNMVGPVVITVMDSVDRSNIYSHSRFFFQQPADIVSVSPSLILRGSGETANMHIAGINFRDSSELVCLINSGQFLVSARWLFNNMVRCDVTTNIVDSIHEDFLTIHVSNNNGADVSNHAAVVPLQPNLFVVDVSPVDGFVSGGTLVTIKFPKHHGTPISCKFGVQTVNTLNVDDFTVAVVAPVATHPGTVTVTVMLDNTEVSSFDFTYHAVPIVNSITPSTLLSKYGALVTIEGEGLVVTDSAGVDRVISGRFTRESGAVVDTVCESTTTATRIACSLSNVPQVAYLHFGASVNDVDFISNLAVVQVFDPTIVVGMMPKRLFSSGGESLEIMVSNMQTGYPLSCVFVPTVALDISQEKSIVEAVPLSDNMVTCLTPPLSPTMELSVIIEQNKQVLYTSKGWSVQSTPIPVYMHPSTLFTGRVSTLEIAFDAPIVFDSSMACVVNGESAVFRMLDDLLGVCVVIVRVPGEFEVKLELGSSVNLIPVTVGMINVVNPVSDLTLNSSAVRNYGKSYLSVLSPSCSIPPSVSCNIFDSTAALDGSASASEVTAIADYLSVVPFNYNPCELVCEVEVGVSASVPTTLYFQVCPTALCDVALLSQMVDVLSVSTIVALEPRQGSELGGDKVYFVGTGFSNDGSVECYFGTNKAPNAVVLSASSILCTVPASTTGPGSVSVSVRSHGLQVSEAFVEYEYITMLSRVELSTSFVSSLGGTNVMATTVDQLSNSTVYSCRMGSEVVYAHMLNSTTLLCRSPPTNYSSMKFSIVINGADVSSTRFLNVDTPPSVLFVDPSVVSASKSINFHEFSIYVGSNDVISVDRVGCALDSSDNSGGLIQISETSFSCSFTTVISAGSHELLLMHDGVVFRKIPIFAKVQSLVYNMFPVVGFSHVATSVMVRTVTDLDTNSRIFCCFNEVKSSAVVVGVDVLECLSPSAPIVSEDLFNAMVYRLGLAGPDGLCEYSGHDFTAIDAPIVESVSESSGFVTGATSILISLAKSIVLRASGRATMLPVVYHCRIGLNTVQATVVDENTLLCITLPHHEGVFAIELSANDVDFISTSFQFEYVSRTGGDIVAPELEHNVPVIKLVSPDTFPAGGKTTVVLITGVGFHLGIQCVVGKAEGVFIRAKFISETEIECILPVHIPGDEFISVQNPGGYMSLAHNIKFVDSAYIFSTASDSTVIPAFGPRVGNTMITVLGKNLASVQKDIYCLIGEDWSYAVSRTDASVQCITPSNTFSGKVMVRLATSDKEFLAGGLYFEYVQDPMIFDSKPDYGSINTELLITGRGFSRMPFVTCYLGDTPGLLTTVINDELVMCTVPSLDAGEYSVTLNTNGQHYLRSGLTFKNFQQAELLSLSPSNGPALRGGTVVTIHGSGFLNTVDVSCVFGASIVPAVVYDDETLQCRTLSHRPGVVNVSVIAEGTLMHPVEQSLQFAYVPDVSVDKIKPQFGYTAGEFTVFVFGSNFINVTALGCRFADMTTRGLYLSNTSMMCLAPSPLGRNLLASTLVKVEVTVNGYDYSESGILFNYSEPCDQGFFCPGTSRQLCPNGTYCPMNSLNFSLCPPGFFQPREGQIDCVVCPVGYICPDAGLMRPVVCPAGQICDVMGLRASRMSCPSGFYCLNGTKSNSINEFLNLTRGSKGDSLTPWYEDYVTGSVLFNSSTYDWSYHDWPYPAVGTSRIQWPPTPQCDGNDCFPGSEAVLAESPFPCPIGHYCRSGATSQISIPKNFSTPQRCFDGFFCPRGSISPEGSGPCPTGYFCPTQLDAVICPQGHYCPGVGNSYPLECYPGTFNPFDGRSNCTVCPTGHICPSWGTLLPELCPAGFVCMALGLSFPVVLCPQGYFCDPGTLTLDPADPTPFRPRACRPGVFCLGGVAYETTVEWIPSQPWGASNAQKCSEGTYCGTGAFVSSGSGLCFPGHYCPPSTSFPISVPKGRFAAGTGSVAPALCFPGTYAPLESQIDCLPCPSGHSCQSYGTYIPSICGVGTYRSQVDSVTCRFCPTGTYSPEIGASDLSQCLPCPAGQVCGTNQMYNLTSSTTCPAGYLCGYGTDRSRQFSHKCPAGFHTKEQTKPELQFESVCEPGFYCERGTPTYLSSRAKCTVGYYCPQSTPSAAGVEVKCPRVTTSLSGTATLQGCRIAEINVCDKQDIDMKRPMEDLIYYNQFQYSTMDDTDINLYFDSSPDVLHTTGEIVSVRKMVPVNRTSSAPGWVNDTIEAFRMCPQYGDQKGGQVVTVIGRNFLDSKTNYCKWRACISANYGRNPKRCLNQVDAVDITKTTLIGEVSTATYITRAKYLSPTRMECEVPAYIFDDNFYETYNQTRINAGAEVEFTCEYVTGEGKLPFFQLQNGTDVWQPGNFSFVRKCQGLAVDCINLPFPDYEYFSNLTFPCGVNDILEGICPNKPEIGFMFNPCYSGEAVVEVSNDGMHYSGGDDMIGSTIISTVRQYDTLQNLYRNYGNYKIPPTFAVFTYVKSEFMYMNPKLLLMEQNFCKLATYSEEGYRERSDGWFQLQLNEAAHVQIDLTHLPNDITYGEHYRIALFVQPSRCKLELCNSQRVRLPAKENLPCKLPVDFSPWFNDLSVPKNVKNNFTVYALEDVIFKVEIHILHGLFVQYLQMFENTTTVRIASPSRAVTNTGLSDFPTRKLSKYVSFEERLVPMQYYFIAVYYQSITYEVSQALNMPPSFQDYERGRVLVMYNVSEQTSEIPTILDNFDDINRGPTFWNMPAATTAETKEMIDAYFETFQGMTFDGTNGYQYDFQTMVLPYLPYFSNCHTFDSYIPIWLLLEGKECELPIGRHPKWRRYNYPALPDQDDIHAVTPFDIGGYPVADVCIRTIQCHYEESLPNPDNTPRWFEAPSDTTLFYVIRDPFDYFQYTGRNGSAVGVNDDGSATAVQASKEQSPDNFIPVVVDHGAGDLIPGCVDRCFARSYEMIIWFYQISNYRKKLVRITLVGDNYDFLDENTDYTLSTNMFALNYIELVLNFAYTMPVYVMLFVVSGLLQNFINLACYLVNRFTTHLQNPPELKMWGYIVLTMPPPAAGVLLAIMPIWILTAVGNNVLNGGEFITSPTASTSDPLGDLILDAYPVEYANIGTVPTAAQMEEGRAARVGTIFMAVAFCCGLASIKMYFPKGESKRERELAERRTKLATREELWQPINWKISNFFMTGFFTAIYCTAVIEFSYGNIFGNFFWASFFLIYACCEFVGAAVTHQLQDALLIMPVMCLIDFTKNIITFGAPDFLSFILTNYIGTTMQVFEKVYMEDYQGFISHYFGLLFGMVFSLVKAFLPKYIYDSGKKEEGMSKEEEEKLKKKREKEGVTGGDEGGGEDEEAESVEPIIEHFAGLTSDSFGVFSMPFIVYLLMQYRDEIGLAPGYGILQSDMAIYLVYQIFLIPFQMVSNIFIYSQNELYNGWKVYEYLVYSRYRFLQRETRWKGMEEALDECIEESLRKMDQMCFSSQYFLMLSTYSIGLIYIVLAMEVWLRTNYSPFSDPGFVMLFSIIVAVYILMEKTVMYIALKLKIWKIKHENTAWHIQRDDEDDLDIPDWDDVKGASHDAYLMNQRITSETFRYKFLNYNRAWLIQQLPQLLTPRTLRRSRPYLINQLARIISSRRDDISDDSGDEKDKKFGPVALTTSSRNIIRWWLGKAKRRLRLKQIVDPLIRKARGAECEQCLSRRQLQVEYEIDIDTMSRMYDNTYPGDEEVDQVQWKSFWMNNQRYHTVCLSCATRRKEVAKNSKMAGNVGDAAALDDAPDAYPDWGPVFLSAASKAIALNWYRKAQRVRAGKKGMRKRDKIVKDISDDEGEDYPKAWSQQLDKVSASTQAIAVFWLQTARTRMLKRAGRGGGRKEEKEPPAATAESFKSGRKSKNLRK